MQLVAGEDTAPTGGFAETDNKTSGEAGALERGRDRPFSRTTEMKART